MKNTTASEDWIVDNAEVCDDQDAAMHIKPLIAIMKRLDAEITKFGETCHELQDQLDDSDKEIQRLKDNLAGTFAKHTGQPLK